MRIALAGILMAATTAQAQLPGAQAPIEAVRTASAAAGTPLRVRLVITENVFVELGRIADSARTETVRCLLGVFRGDSALIDLAYQPPISYADEGYVVFTGCPVSTIAQWHNHLPDARFAPEYGCYMSAVDVEAALDDRAPPAQIVQVDSRTFCWWTRVQIRTAIGLNVFPPLRSQFTGRMRLDESICTGEAVGSLGCQLLRSREVQFAGKGN